LKPVFFWALGSGWHFRVTARFSFFNFGILAYPFDGHMP
jgi:hypothetical protein